MLLTADWALPISRRPIPQGAVLVRGDHIAEIGPSDELVARYPAEERVELRGCVLMPGLVNAHTHLGLSAVDGLLEPAPFTDWLPQIVAAMRAWTAEDYAASTALGAARSLAAGVTVVGDIAYNMPSVEAAAATGLAGTFFFEVLGIQPRALDARLDELGFGDCRGLAPRIRCGLSPHTLYSSGPSLLRAVAALARDRELPIALHVGETSAEAELVQSGGGGLAPVAHKLAPDFRPDGSTPVAYLDRLGVLDGATAIHLCQTWPSDVARLAATTRGAVTCPRSNAWLHNGIAPVEAMIAAGVPVGLGTDSLASTPDLDLMEEARALLGHFPRLTPASLLEMLTLHGAVAIGAEERFGALEPGMQADVVAYRLAADSDPEAAVVAHAGASVVEAVITGGEWRVRDGVGLLDTAAIEAAAAEARAKAAEALG